MPACRSPLLPSFPGMDRRESKGSVGDENPAQALRQALREQDWSTVVRTVELSWAPLLQHERELLDEALRAVPNGVHVSIRWRAIRAMRFHEIQFDLETVDPLETPLPTDRRTLSRLAGSDAAYDTLLTAQLLMLAFRVRGAVLQASAHADITRHVARVGRLSRPELSELEPRVTLQVGITYLLAGRLDDAVDCLSDLHQRAASGSGSHVRPDAALKLAVAHAMMGDVTIGRRWLEHAGGVAGGESPRELAEHLRLSHNTVKSHLHRIYLKLEVSSREQAIERAAQSGLITIG